MTNQQEVQKSREKGKQEGQLEQNKQEPPLSFVSRVMITGFFGGVFWSFLAYVAHIFNFTSIGPNMILIPFAVGDWKYETLGHLLGILAIGLVSILVALLYYVTLKRFQSIWVGAMYGLVLWGFVFIVLKPLFPDMEPITKIGINTNVTTICTYLLFGVFVGYSISFEANEIQNHQGKEVEQ
ncbi:YqhR family membrane protein [Bacillus carboniphilus]|uniref:YqhR family membrane protein n=1 Tax=Bacillus carboniphilus TaxID=86663 RepID=A0ABY9JWZ0_9BACI|nr:YqhR family membrane protein [Bacillus carboniphilus]WLR43901.1 YqhR family membrane protein [Bacillus carboniphilus]